MRTERSEATEGRSFFLALPSPDMPDRPEVDSVLRTVRPLEENAYSSILGSGILTSLGLGSRAGTLFASLTLRASAVTAVLTAPLESLPRSGSDREQARSYSGFVEMQKTRELFRGFLSNRA